MSVQTMMMMGIVPLGVMLMGSVGTFVGVDVTVLVGGLLLAVLAVFAGLRSAALRRATGERHGSRRPRSEAQDTVA